MNRPRRVLLLCLAAVMAAVAPPSAAQDHAQVLNTTREEMTGVLSILDEIIAQNRGGSRDADLLQNLAAVVAIEQSLLESVLEFGRETLGRPIDRLTDEQKNRLEQLAREQANAETRFGEWWEAFRVRYGEEPTTTLSRAYDQIDKTDVPGRIGGIAAELRLNHLVPAANALKSVLEDLQEALRFIEQAFGRSGDPLEKSIAQLKDTIARQKELLEETREHEDNNTEDLRESHAQRQSSIRRVAESLADTFEASGMEAGRLLRGTGPEMEFSTFSLRRGNYSASIDSQRKIIAVLEEALILALEAMERRNPESAATSPSVEMPAIRRKNAQRMAMRMLGQGGSGQNALAEVMADLNAVRDLREQQAALRNRTVSASNDAGSEGGGSGATAAAESVDRQRNMASLAESLAMRVLDYDSGSAEHLVTASEFMGQAAGQMTGNAERTVVAQDAALVALDSAIEGIQEFWNLLMEAMLALMQEGGPASMMGGGADSGRELDEVVRQEMMAMLRAMVRMNALRLEQLALAETVASASNGEANPDPAPLSNKQAALAKDAFAIANIERLDPHVAGAMMGVRRLMTGARIQVDIAHWPSAHEHAVRAVQGIAIVVAEMGSMVGSMQSSSEVEMEGQDFAVDTGGLGGGGASVSIEGRRWLARLPEREREAIEQTLSEPLPAEYEALVRAYYRKLSEDTEE